MRWRLHDGFDFLRLACEIECPEEVEEYGDLLGEGEETATSVL